MTLSITRYQLLINTLPKLDYSVLVVLLKYILFRSEGKFVDDHAHQMNAFKTPIINVQCDESFRNRTVHILPFEYFLYKTINTGTVYRLLTHLFRVQTADKDTQYNHQNNSVYEVSTRYKGIALKDFGATDALRHNQIELQFSTLYPNTGPMLLADLIERCVLAHMHALHYPNAHTYQVSICDFTPTRQLYVPIQS